jgi:uncharacterized protein YjbI with pentapeptide repeats
MTNTPTPLDPIASIVAKYQSNTVPTEHLPVPQTQYKKGWTGFAERTVWDWLNLLGVLLVPLMIGVGTILITAQQNAISQGQHDSDQRIANSQHDSNQRIADNQFQEALLKTFRDDISRLILDEHLLTAKHDDPVQVMAQSYTNDALKKLDLPRRVLLIQFLGDLHLVTSATKDRPLISLTKVSLNGADLIGVKLNGADLNHADLNGADLNHADLSEAGLSGADLSGADLSGAHLHGVSLYRAGLIRADLSGADLSGAYLTWANLRAANLGRALLSLADLHEADLQAANLQAADLQAANVTPKQL